MRKWLNWDIKVWKFILWIYGFRKSFWDNHDFYLTILSKQLRNNLQKIKRPNTASLWINIESLCEWKSRLFGLTTDIYFTDEFFSASLNLERHSDPKHLIIFTSTPTMNSHNVQQLYIFYIKQIYIKQLCMISAGSFWMCSCTSVSLETTKSSFDDTFITFESYLVFFFSLQR